MGVQESRAACKRENRKQDKRKEKEKEIKAFTVTENKTASNSKPKKTSFMQMALGKDLLVYDAHTWRPYCHVQDFAMMFVFSMGNVGYYFITTKYILV